MNTTDISTICADCNVEYDVCTCVEYAIDVTEDRDLVSNPWKVVK